MTFALISLAFAFWFVMFSPWTAPHLNFWAVMALATAVLGGASLILDRRKLRELYAWKNEYVLIGVLSAVFLYGIFWLGDIASKYVLSFAGAQIENIYATKAQASPLSIGLLLLLWVGPAEEVFWRGFIQTRLANLMGYKCVDATANSKLLYITIAKAVGCPQIRAFVFTSLLYALAHVWSFNLMLFGASLVCGMFWSAMYAWYRSVWPGLISHALWDLAIFVLWPMS